MNKQTMPIKLMMLSFLGAAVLSVVPLPDMLTWFRPEWFLIVLLYWLLSAPHSVSLSAAWGIGIFNDLLVGGVLGGHALIFVCVVYLMKRFQHRIAAFPIQQQLMAISLFLTLQVLCSALLDRLNHDIVSLGFYGIVAVASIISWPLVGMLLHRFHYQDQAWRG